MSAPIRVALAAFALALLVALFGVAGAADDVPPADVCHEDEPCWDCETMGNMVCGPTTTAAPVLAPPLVLERTG